MRRLAIIIPTFNRKELLANLLVALKHQTYDLLDFNVVVVVDGSTDGTVDMIQEGFPSVKMIIGDGTWWWTKSINEGIKYAIREGFDLFLLMNDDTYVDPDFLEGLVGLYLQQGGGLLGAISITNNYPYKIFFSGINSVNWATAKFNNYHKFLSDYSSIDRNSVMKSIFLPGRGMLFDIKVLKKIGLFNSEVFPQYYADYDFSYRAFKLGFPVYISWKYPIYSYVNLTGKGNKTNSTFYEFLISIKNPMSPNSFLRTWNFYRSHGGKNAYIGFFMHYLRKTISFLLFVLKKRNK